MVACALVMCGVLKYQCVALGWPRERRALCVLLVCTQGRCARLPVEFGVINVWIRLNRCRVRVFGIILMGIRLASACGAAEAFPVGPPKKRKRGCRRLVAIHGRDGAAAACREMFRTQETMMRDDAYASCASPA